jgi:hypothetical protein
MTNRTTKTLLLAVAVGLWLNVVTPWFQPTPVHANSAETQFSARQVRELVAALDTIADEIENIARGRCLNPKLC